MNAVPDEESRDPALNPMRAWVCDGCGAAEAVQFDERWLCPDGYSCRGACCAGEE